MHVIHVTADDIKRGSPGSSVYCPVALAMRRVIADLPKMLLPLEVTDAGIKFSDLRFEVRVRCWIRRFDRGYRGSPFAIYLPDEIRYSWATGA